MAVLFDLDDKRDARGGAGVREVDALDAAFELISGHIAGLAPAAALARIRRYQNKLCALEVVVIAKLKATPGGDRIAKNTLNDGKTSRSTINKKTRRAEAAAKNAALLDKLAEGELSPEQLDVIAETSAKTDGAAAVDGGFISAVAGVDPDQARVIADKFIADHADPDKVQSEHDRQRAMRAARKNKAGPNGLDTIKLEGDAVSIAEMWGALLAKSNQLYENDGGRDVDLAKHRRTHDQRMFDAAHELICGTPGARSRAPATEAVAPKSSWASAWIISSAPTQPHWPNRSASVSSPTRCWPVTSATATSWPPSTTGPDSRYGSDEPVGTHHSCNATRSSCATKAACSAQRNTNAAKSTTSHPGTHPPKAPPTSTNSPCSAPAATTPSTPTTGPCTGISDEGGEPDPPNPANPHPHRSTTPNANERASFRPASTHRSGCGATSGAHGTTRHLLGVAG